MQSQEPLTTSLGSTTTSSSDMPVQVSCAHSNSIVEPPPGVSTTLALTKHRPSASPARGAALAGPLSAGASRVITEKHANLSFVFILEF